MLDAADPLAGEAFLVVADLQGKAQNARITAAAAVAEADIRAALGRPDRDDAAKASFDRDRRAVRVRETVRLGAITLVRAHAAGALRRRGRPRHHRGACASTGCRCCHWSKEAETLRQRLALAASRPRRALARHVGRGAARPPRRLAAAVPDRRGVALPRIDPGALLGGADVAGAARSAAQGRRAGADPFRRAVRQPRADPL